MFSRDSQCFSYSCTSSGGGSSQFPQTEEGKGLRGEELDDDLMFDIDANLEADDRVEPSLAAPRLRSRRSRFLSYLSRAKAYTREVDGNIIKICF